MAGSSIQPFGRSKDGRTWRDRAFLAASAALSDAAVSPGDIDALVIATESDLVSLQVNPAPVVSSDLGLPHLPCVRVEGGGASGALAVRSGVHHILSGLYRSVLVVGFDDAASHLDRSGVSLVYGLSFDAEVEGFLGATAAALYALSAQAHMARHGVNERHLATVAVKNRANAVANPNAHLPMISTVEDVLASAVVAPPLKRLDCSPLSDGAAALVLSRERNMPRQSERVPVRIVASASASDWARLGDRDDIGRFAGKSRAAAAAYSQAGIMNPSSEIDVAEVYDAFTSAEVQGIEALGLAPEGRGARQIVDGVHDRDGRLPVNLSGGLLGQGGSPGAVGVAQVATIARLLQGRYHGGLQPTLRLRRGLAEAHGGIATLNCVHVLENDE
ncbi:MAG: thiolase family protein [Hyphomicrobiaceae bacterium]